MLFCNRARRLFRAFPLRSSRCYRTVIPGPSDRQAFMMPVAASEATLFYTGTRSLSRAFFSCAV